MSGPTSPDKPKTLEGFKSAAKRLKKSGQAATHTDALEKLARSYGFANYSAAHQHYTSAEGRA